MNKNKTAGDTISIRVIDEITFQASLLALHTAIEFAGKGTGAMRDDGPLHKFVQVARRSAGTVDSLERPDDPRCV